MFCEKGVLRNISKFTGKQLCQGLIFNIAQVFSRKFCEISKNTFFHRTPLVAASERENEEDKTKLELH